MQDNEFDMIADEGQIADMNREYDALGVGAGKTRTALFQYPIPVYMTDKCADFCRCCKEMTAIIAQFDRIFVSRNRKNVEFILNVATKNRIRVSVLANFANEVFVGVQKMPLKQSMYRLLELHNSMSVTLCELADYVKGAEMQEIISAHLLAGSVLHGICI